MGIAGSGRSGGVRARGERMSSFRERFGRLTVQQAKELNEAARLTCEFEATAQRGE